MEDLANNARGLPPPQSYEAALWAAHKKMMETTATLQSDLDRLNSKPRGRSPTHSQSGNCHRTQPGSWQRRHSRSQCRACSSQWVENWVRPPSPDHLQMHYQDKRAHSPDHTQSLPHRWMSFCMPEGEDTTPHRPVSFCMPEGEDTTPHRWMSFLTPEGEDTTIVKEPVTVKLTAEDLETWLEHQAGQLGTPTWWRELEVIPDIKDPCKFARKIQASFYIPEV